MLKYVHTLKCDFEIVREKYDRQCPRACSLGLWRCRVCGLVEGRSYTPLPQKNAVCRRIQTPASAPMALVRALSVCLSLNPVMAGLLFRCCLASPGPSLTNTPTACDGAIGVGGGRCRER